MKEYDITIRVLECTLNKNRGIEELNTLREFDITMKNKKIALAINDKIVNMLSASGISQEQPSKPAGKKGR